MTAASQSLCIPSYNFGGFVFGQGCLEPQLGMVGNGFLRLKAGGTVGHGVYRAEENAPHISPLVRAFSRAYNNYVAENVSPSTLSNAGITIWYVPL